MKPRCFVVMPFGQKMSSRDTMIDFDEVYRELIVPAAGSTFDVVSMDELLSNSSILDINIQLISDSPFTVFDTTTNNPNVLYELGVRHALSPRGTLIIRQQGSLLMPYDLHNFFSFLYRYPFSDDNSGPIGDQVTRLSWAIDKIYSDKTSNHVYRIARYAKQYEEYQEELERFHSVAPYEQSVFIMTKFPRRDESVRTDKDRRLDHIINTVKRAIKGRGYTPRVASEKHYHHLLWKSIEVYLLGCSKGVAIVEDKHSQETNPNVSMEWGWMRAERKDVLYLLENEFANERADFSGFLSERFSWDFPDEGIEDAINRWLTPYIKVVDDRPGG